MYFISTFTNPDIRVKTQMHANSSSGLFNCNNCIIPAFQLESDHSEVVFFSPVHMNSAAASIKFFAPCCHKSKVFTFWTEPHLDQTAALSNSGRTFADSENMLNIQLLLALPPLMHTFPLYLCCFSQRCWSWNIFAAYVSLKKTTRQNKAKNKTIVNLHVPSPSQSIHN